MLLRGVSGQQAAKAISDRRMHADAVRMSLREGSGQQAAQVFAGGCMHAVHISLRGRGGGSRQNYFSGEGAACIVLRGGIGQQAAQEKVSAGEDASRPADHKATGSGHKRENTGNQQVFGHRHRRWARGGIPARGDGHHDVVAQQEVQEQGMWTPQLHLNSLPLCT